MTIHEKKEEILEAIEARRIVIIKGATGCGKTTQIPKLVFESDTKRHNIVVTQPRRIAAMSIAKRVAKEMNCAVGTTVGYQIGLDKKGSDATKILYVTTGILLQKLIKDKHMREFTHYFIDEIHEREQDMDFVLIVVRRFLNSSSKDCKLILMSATLDTQKFQQYLVSYHNNMEFQPRVIDIDVPTPYRIYKWYLDDLSNSKSACFHSFTSVPFSAEEPGISNRIYETAMLIIQNLDRTDSIAAEDDEEKEKLPRGKPAVLVFLPGIAEIETMEKTLKQQHSQSASLWIKPLHSSVPTDEQQDVFRNPPKPSMRKIILSTNIAESSVTVPDIEYVIDFCLTKCLVVDDNTGCSSLELKWASKNSLTQRAGRVGRTSTGKVYRLIPKEFYKTLSKEAIPEMLRCSLENLILKAKFLDIDSPTQILSEAMDPPDLTNIHLSVANLKEVGALLLNAGEEYDPTDGDITLMGRVLAFLPVDVRLGKLIYLGNILGVPEECIIMASAMATKNLFSTPYGKNLESYDAKLKWARSTCSDCFAFLNAYTDWRALTTRGELNSARHEQNWARDTYLQLNALRELAAMEYDIKRRLQHHGLYTFEEGTQSFHSRNKSGNYSNEKTFFMRLAIAAAFYPNYFVRGCQPLQNEEKQAISILGGHDPFSSVYLLGLPPNQPTVIYKKAVGKLFRSITDRLDVSMDNGTKAYVTFRRPLSEVKIGAIPGKIEMAVYKAVKLRHIGFKFTIPKIRADEATNIYHKYLKQNDGEENVDLQKEINKLVWPWNKDDYTFSTDILEVRISYVESPQKFWIQSSMKNASEMLKEITYILNRDDVLIKLPANSSLSVGSVYVTEFVVEGETDRFHRCRILSKSNRRSVETPRYTVQFVDYGNSCEVFLNNIYDVKPDVKESYFIDKLPDLAVECSLVKVQPVSDKFSEEPSHSKWNERASGLLKSMENRPTFAKVYSVVNGVLRIKIVQPSCIRDAYKFEHTVNYDLINRGYAEKSDEDYLSYSSREELKTRRRMNQDEIGEKKKYRANVEHNLNLDDLTLPDDRDECTLKGPFSPLEMKLSSMTNAITSKQVFIEKYSVNTVLLNSNPSDPKDRMLVAAYVGTNPSGHRLNLMQTTLMPNLAALPMLCCLLFSPMAELRCNPTFTRYSGAVCGLGYDKKTKKSLYPANDLEVVFDHEISDSELELINKIRYWLNVSVNPGTNGNNLKNEHLVQCTTKLKEYLKILFFEKRYELQEPYFTVNTYRWGLVKRNQLRDPRPERDVIRHPAEYCGSVYRLIWAVRRAGDVEEERKNILKNLERLKDFSEDRLTQASLECELCRVVLTNPTCARTHLKEPEHRRRSKRYLKKDDDTS